MHIYNHVQARGVVPTHVPQLRGSIKQGSIRLLELNMKIEYLTANQIHEGQFPNLQSDFKTRTMQIYQDHFIWHYVYLKPECQILVIVGAPEDSQHSKFQVHIVKLVGPSISSSSAPAKPHLNHHYGLLGQVKLIEKWPPDVLINKNLVIVGKVSVN